MTAAQALLRIRHRRRELLRARDLQADVDAEARRRSLHVVGAHRTRGVALGLEVALPDDDSGVIVSPGLAYGRCGEEVVSSRTTFLPAPKLDAGTDVVLTVAPRTERDGCAAPGDLHGPQWHWRPDRVPPDEIALARFRVEATGLGAPDFAVRRGTHALPPAQVAVGTEQLVLPLATLAYNSFEISTQRAGFDAVPYYFVTLAEAESSGFAALPHEAWPHVRGPFLRVRESTPWSFWLDIRVGIRSAAFDAVVDSGRLPGELVVDVDWMGVVPTPRAEPTVDAGRVDSPWGAPLPAPKALESLVFVPDTTSPQID